MTKNEAMELAHRDAELEWSRMDQPACLQMDRSEFVLRVQSMAASRAPNGKLAAVFYQDAFVRAIVQRRDNAFGELPEVKLAQRNRSIDRRIENMLGYQSTVDKFAARLAEDACNAFEWGEDAIKAAATVLVGRRLKAAVEAEAGGYDYAIKAARREALRGARYPEHSTSAVSNLTKSYVTAAYADFVAYFEED